MNKIQIENRSNLPTINYKKLKDFQGNLKKLSEENLNKLKNAIVKYGFTFPKAVWINEENYYIIDGHQTKTALAALEKEGWEIPKIPYYEVKAENRKEAKKKLLLINSSFGQYSKEGIENFIDDIDFEEFVSDFNFNEIEFDFLSDIDDEIEEKELQEYEKVHFLISIDLENIMTIKKIKDFLTKNEINYEQSAN
jgi:ParB-like chromosome segregation protein Spo0J